MFAVLLALAQAQSSPVLVSTPLGLIEGRYSVSVPSVREFLGIPYAQPPVGSLRWARPVPATPWGESTLQAVEYGPTCPQPADPNQFNSETLLGYYYGTQSEDCLYLNVWTPEECANTDCSLPVLVWIHGGAFVVGGANYPIYDGGALAAKGAIVVTIQYRLGILGIFANMELREQDPQAGNFWLHDQQLALRWVQSHIASFGGNPSQVTVFGESAGSFSIAYHMVTPSSFGLFRRAVMISGSPIQNPNQFPTPEIALYASNAILAAVNCESIECARQVSWEQLVPLVPEGWWAVPDETFIPDPATAFNSGRHIKPIDVLVIGMRNESTMFTPLLDMTIEQYFGDLFAFFGDYAGDVHKKYSPDFPWETPGFRSSVIHDDWFFTCPSRSLLQILSRTSDESENRNLYQVVFDHQPSWFTPDFTVLGVAHSSANSFVFGATMFPFTDEEAELSENVQHSILQFAETGIVPDFPKYAEESELYAIADTTLSTDAHYRKDECDFWAELGTKPPSCSNRFELLAARFLGIWGTLPQAPQNTRIVAVGDSNLDNWDNPHYCGEGPDCSTSIPGLFNKGIGGATCRDMRNIAYELAYQYGHTDWIILHCGQNDMKYGQCDENDVTIPLDANKAIELFGSVAYLIHYYGGETGPQVLYPGGTLYPATTRDEQFLLYDYYMQYFSVYMAATTTGKPPLVFIDAQSVFASLGNPASLYAEDGIHWSPAGYHLWTQWIKTALEADGDDADCVVWSDNACRVHARDVRPKCVNHDRVVAKYGKLYGLDLTCEKLADFCEDEALGRTIRSACPTTCHVTDNDEMIANIARKVGVNEVQNCSDATKVISCTDVDYGWALQRLCPCTCNYVTFM